VDDEAKKRNQNLPGMGGVYNLVNLHVYHYAGNNPVKYTDPDGRNSVWDIDEQTKKIEITIPVKFEPGTTAEQKKVFSEAAKEWEGTYSINGEDYSVSVNVVEVTDSKRYNGRKVNTVTFSSSQRNDDGDPALIPNVKGSKNMTLYIERNLKEVITHEIGHLLGLRDRYQERKDPITGNRDTPARDGWGSNIMGNTYNGIVEGRNFEEGLRRFANKKNK